jgi:hypothetical protein
LRPFIHLDDLVELGHARGHQVDVLVLDDALRLGEVSLTRFFQVTLVELLGIHEDLAHGEVHRLYAVGASQMVRILESRMYFSTG